MHEWALADAVVTSVIKVAREQGIKTISRVKINSGELQQIDQEIFEYALKEIMQPQSALLSKAEIELAIEEAQLKCRVCGHEWLFNEAMKELTEEQAESIHFLPEIAHVYMRCPVCESPDFEFIKGRGLWIESIEGE